MIITATPNSTLSTATPVVQTVVVPQTVIVPQIVTQTVIVEVTPPAQSVTQAPAAAPSTPTPASLLFQEEFDGPNLDESKWEASGPPVTIKDGVIHLESNLSVSP